VFVSAGRLLSFKKAADDLHVTASAVSQQIKALESHLDVILFDRTPKGIFLTEAGQQYFDLASSTLQDFENGLKNFKASTKETPLRLSTTPFLACELLIPAMYEYSSKELRIETSEDIIDFESEDCHAAVRIGSGEWSSCVSREIMPVQIAITGSPTLIQDITFSDITDLKKFPLIHSSAKADHWKDVSDYLEIDLRENKHIIFDNYIAAVAAAERGMGLLVTLLPITNNRIKESKLISLYTSTEPTSLGYYYVEKRGNTNQIHNETLFEWVKQQFDKINY
jgi:LysR family glycine cleavage system transcriptional activator